MSYDWIVIAYPTIMDGLVLRWYASEEAAHASRPHISASRNAVEVYVLGELVETARPEADAAHRRLKASYEGNYKRVQATATHRWSLPFGHGDLLPVAAEVTS